MSKPIVAVSRLEAVAAQSERETPYVASFIDAQRGQIFGALYQKAENGLTLVEQEMVASPEVFMDWVDNQVAGADVAWISTDADTRGAAIRRGRAEWRKPRRSKQCRASWRRLLEKWRFDEH